MSSTIAQTLSFHRESVTSALIEGRIPRLQDLQDEVLAAIVGQPGEHRARREIDRLPERLLFEWMTALRDNSGGSPLDEATLIAHCRELMGDDRVWLPRFREVSSTDCAGLGMVLTWPRGVREQHDPAQPPSGQAEPHAIMQSAVELLASADQSTLDLHFYCGGSTTEWETIRAGFEAADTLRTQRDVRCIITTHGDALTPERLRWLSQHRVHLQLTLDVPVHAQPSHTAGETVHDPDVNEVTAILHELDLDYAVILTVHPDRAGHVVDDWRHIVSRGYRRLQLQWMQTIAWRDEDINAFKAGLHTLAAELRTRWERGDDLTITNLGEPLQRVSTHRELIVDWGGTIYARNAVLFPSETRKTLRVGHLDDGKNWLHYRLTGPNRGDAADAMLLELLPHSNARVSAVLNSWVRWMNDQEPPLPR